jgi:hypothetical protein
MGCGRRLATVVRARSPMTTSNSGLRPQGHCLCNEFEMQDIMDEDDEILPPGSPNSWAVKKALFDWLAVPDYFALEVRRALSATGLTVKRVERCEPHPVWTATLRNDAGVEIPVSPRRAGSWLYRILEQNGLNIERDPIIVAPCGRSVRVSFMMFWGWSPPMTEEAPPGDAPDEAGVEAW